MLHAKFQDNRTLDLDKKILKVFTIFGHICHETWTIYTNFLSSCPRRALIG